MSRSWIVVLLAAGACREDVVTPVAEPDTPDATLPGPACGAVSLSAFAPDAARFAPSAPVGLHASVAHGGGSACTANLRVAFVRRGDLVGEATAQADVPAGETRRVTFSWRPPPDDFRGYSAVLSADGTDAVLATAIDVSSTPTRYPRYGYVSAFPPGQTREQSAAIVETLAERFHLDLFQLYDWFFRHEDLVPQADTWTDLFGREIARATVQDLVDAIHAENATAMGYVAMYAAREGYEQRSGVSPAWGLYETKDASAQVSLAFGGGRFLFLFDPGNPAWQAKMASEYVDAVRTFGFDGVHVDQFGPRPTLYRADGSPVDLSETYAPFLEAIDAALEREAPGHDLCIFNIVDGSVDGYGVRPVATSPACDVLYSELWYTTDTYEALRAYVEQLREIGRGRSVVLAVYPQYGEDIGTVLEAEDARLDGPSIGTDHVGFSGDGFVEGFSEPGQAITWRVNLPEPAAVTFVFRYANATGQRATRTVLVDGRPIGKVSFASRPSWDDWAFDAWLQQRLDAGDHEVTLRFADDDAGAVNVDRLTLGEFNEAAVRLQNAVVFASGATPIQIGDDVQSLAHEYFPNRSKAIRPSLERALERDFSFITAHEELLFAPDVVPVEARLGAIDAVSPEHTLIAEGAGGIWTVLRRSSAGDIVHLVNLVGVDNARWRDSAPTPAPQANVRLRYRVDDATRVRRVSWATPDEGPGTFEPLAFTRGDGFIELEVPRLAYWDMVLVERD